MEFMKMQGTGNDFLVIEGPFSPGSDDVIAWCARRTGVGADGVLVAARVGAGRVSMRYWNADGGEAEMCGNGLRCVARYAYDRQWVDEPEFIVESAVADHRVAVSEADVVAFVGEPAPFRTGTLTIAGFEVHPFAIGNPHAVLFVDDVAAAPVHDVGPVIERDPLFPDRTNVEFVEVLEEGGVRVRIWERGVGETQASGTGAVAAAFMAHTVHEVATPVVVHLLGGDLMVWFDEEGAWTQGPADYVFEGSIN